MQQNLKLYSSLAIAIATFFGGPLAAGILVRRNSLNLGRPQQARSALVLGIVFTALLFFLVYSIPERIIDSVGLIMPVVYTAIILLVVDKVQGDALKAHREQKRPFYSGWRAAGVGALSFALIFGTGVLFYTITGDHAPGFDVNTYNARLDHFAENEEQAMDAFDALLYDEPGLQVAAFQRGLIKWQENLQIVEQLKQMEHLSPALETQNQMLGDYTRLRIKQYELIIRSILEETDAYDEEIQETFLEIEELFFYMD
jgi:hypothetical protein